MRVLVVDDDALLRRALARVLQRDFEVEQAVDVAGAVGQLETRAFHAIVTDEQLPDGSGRALLARARMLQPACRRALMSGGAAGLEADQACERFFSKPSDVGDVLPWLRSLATERP